MSRIVSMQFWTLTSIALLALASPVALAEGEQVPSFIQKLDASRAFIECVGRERAARGLNEEDVPGLLKEKGMGADLVARVSELADEDERGALASAAGNDAQVDAVFALAAKRIEEDASAVGAMAILEQINIVEAEAINSKCEIPPHLLPGGDPERDWVFANKDTLKAAMEFSRCVNDQADPEAGDRFLEDAMPSSMRESVRSEMIARVSRLPGGEKYAVQIRDAKTIDQAMSAYMSSGFSGFDMRQMTEMTVYTAYYRNRFGNQKCQASPDVLKLGGIAQ